MSDYLSNLVARQLGMAEFVRPRLAGRFEPRVDAVAPDAMVFAADADAYEHELQEVIFDVEQQERRAPGGLESRVSEEEQPRPGTLTYPKSQVISPLSSSDFSGERHSSGEAERKHTSGTLPPALKVPEQVIVTPPRDEPARVAGPPRQAALPSEPEPAEALKEDEPPRARPVAQTRPAVAPPRPPPPPPPHARGESHPEVRATLTRRDDHTARRQISMPADVSDAPVREGRIVPAVAGETTPAAPARDSVEAHGEKTESHVPVSARLNAKLSATTVRLRDGRHIPSRPQASAETRAGENALRLRDGVTPSVNTFPHERQSAVEPLAAAEAFKRVDVEPAPARATKQKRESAAAESRARRPAQRERTEAALTIEPQISRHVPRAAAARDAARASTEAAPTINVTIGRVEVRATPTPSAPAARRADNAPNMSLDDYLRRRAGGGAG